MVLGVLCTHRFYQTQYIEFYSEKEILVLDDKERILIFSNLFNAEKKLY